jgi:hypothetical protein
MQVSLLLRGNGYAVILRDGRGRPTDLIPINPDRVWIYEAPGGEIFYQVARRGRDEVFAPHLEQQIEHLGIQHVPGTHLLLDHVDACLLVVHVNLPMPGDRAACAHYTNGRRPARPVSSR